MNILAQCKISAAYIVTKSHTQTQKPLRYIITECNLKMMSVADMW